MLIRELTAEHIYLACGHTDMRKSSANGRIQWPDEPKDVLEISEQQLRWLTEGLTGDSRWTAESLQRGGGRGETECARAVH